ncbi:MAG: HDOD domain-containing protein [Pseudomonadota bacterium]
MEQAVEKTPLELLLEQMDEGGDFPALSRTIAEINRAIGDENARANLLTDIILRDISLTKKLLRLVNAAHYGSFGSQPISTISRAVVILGFDAVRDAAVSLMLFEHLKDRAHVDELKGEAVDSFYRGILGRMLAASAGVRDSEEAFISALFRDLGRLMARFHFYDKTLEVARLMEADLLSEEGAALKVFGVDYDQLGLAIARQWHFPPTILHAMSPLDPGPVKAGGDGARLQVVANLARDLHRSVAGKRPEEQEQALDGIYLRYREAAHVTRESLAETSRKAVETLRAEASIMGVDISKSRGLPLPPKGKGEQAKEAAAEAEREAAEAAQADQADGADPTAILALGMQDLTAMLLGTFNLADVFKLAAEVLYRTQMFDHVLICVLDRASQCLVGRAGLGPKALAMRSAFRIPLSFAPDVFHAATAKAQDILISDATAANIRSRIPDWYVRAADAHAFLLLPVVVEGRPLALIYADRSNEPLRVPSQVLGLIKALRNQTALAVRQKI